MKQIGIGLFVFVVGGFMLMFATASPSYAQTPTPTATPTSCASNVAGLPDLPCGYYYGPVESIAFDEPPTTETLGTIVNEQLGTSSGVGYYSYSYTYNDNTSGDRARLWLNVDVVDVDDWPNATFPDTRIGYAVTLRDDLPDGDCGFTEPFYSGSAICSNSLDGKTAYGFLTVPSAFNTFKTQYQVLALQDYSPLHLRGIYSGISGTSSGEGNVSAFLYAVYQGDTPPAEDFPWYTGIPTGTVITHTMPGPIGPIPIGSAGEVCYLCQSPTGYTMYFVSHWIAWLGCVLRNLFSCDLRVWFLITWNWLRGIVGIATAWVVWIPTEAQAAILWSWAWLQGGVDWFNAYGRSQISVINNNNGTNIWDLLIAIVGLISDLIGIMSGLLLGIMKLVGNLATGLWGIFDVSAIEFSFGDGTSLEQAVSAAQGQAGGSKEKLIYILLLGAGLFDAGVGNAVVATILSVALGVASIYMIYHLIQEFQMLDF